MTVTEAAPDVVVPDSIEAVEEWRTWNFIHDRLVSHNGVVWEPGEPLKATCVGGSGNEYEWTIVRSGMTREQAVTTARTHNKMQSASRSITLGWRFPHFVTVPAVEPPDGYGYALERVTHNTPNANCTCGIYAGRKASDCPPGDVLGKVTLWGTIVPGEKGSRAEFAYPSELHVRPKHANDPALLAYGVPIVVVDAKEIAASTQPGPSIRKRHGWEYRLVIGLNLGAMVLNLGSVAMRAWL